MSLNLLLLGPQGAGKGTQAKRISAEYGIPHISTGDMLRAEIAAGTELGERVRPILERGALVEDDLMIEVIRSRLGAPDTQNGFILDGFPRTMGQAEALDTALQDLGRELDVVFELQLADDACLERVLGRADAEGRTDDTRDAVQRRLDLYHEQTEPVIEHYRARGLVVGVHADRSINEVFAEIQQALDHVAVR